MAQLLIDRPTTQRLPSTWTAAHVQVRLVDACQVELRLPGPRGPGRGGGSWPVTVKHDFTDMVFWDDARARVWENWKRAQGAYPYEVTLMEEALTWLALLSDHPGEQRCVRAWALATAARKSLRSTLRRFGCSRTTFYRRRDDGSRRIADILNARGTAVR
jgi:hypothetical protein